MFRACPSGFQITFANGWTVSVQHGVGNYCEHQWRDGAHTRTSATAEVGIVPPEGEHGEIEVEGWCTPDRVAEIIAEVAAL